MRLIHGGPAMDIIELKSENQKLQKEIDQLRAKLKIAVMNLRQASDAISDYTTDAHLRTSYSINLDTLANLLMAGEGIEPSLNLTPLRRETRSAIEPTQPKKD